MNELSLDQSKILVLTDDPDLVRTIETEFRDSGAIVQAAQTSAFERGLSSIISGEFDLAILSVEDLSLFLQDQTSSSLRIDTPLLVAARVGHPRSTNGPSPSHVAAYLVLSDLEPGQIRAVATRAITHLREMPSDLTRTLFEQAPVAMFLLRPADGKVLELNASAAAVLGRRVSREESLLDFVSPGDRVLFGSRLQYLSGSGDSTGQVRLIHEGEETIPFGFRMSRAEFAGEPFVLLTGRDLTGGIQAERRYQTLFECALEGIVVHDAASGRILDCNPAFERLSGETRERLVDRRVTDLWTEDDGGSAEDHEADLRSSDGNFCRVVVRNANILLDGTARVVSFVRDITGERAAARRYRQLFTHVPIPIVIIDTEGKVADANSAFEMLSGFTIHDLLQRTFTSLLDAEGKPEECDTQLVAQDGERIPVLVSITPLEYVSHYLSAATVRDVRAEIRQGDLERSLERAQRMEALGQMASGIAHDFNNTLMAALPWSDLLRRKFPGEELVAKATGHIRSAIHRASAVTRQLLDFAQPRKPQRTPIELAEFVRKQLKIMRPAIPPEISMDLLPSEELRADIDGAQLSQVLLNLALNARDAMPDGGSLAFRVRRPSPDEAKRWGTRSLAVIEVSDTGSGIAPKDVRRIFDPFFTTKDVGRGSGLGLAVVHRIVREHDGAIHVQSELNRGTSFQVVLPLLPSSTLEAEAGPAEGASGISGATVVIFDDEQSIAEGLAAVLELRGAKVKTFASGREGLAALDGGLIADFIVLDFGLPEMRGDAVHEEIRKRFPSIPVLISSGYGMDPRIQPLLSDPRTRFLAKPYDVDTLVAQMQSFRH